MWDADTLNMLIFLDTVEAWKVFLKSHFNLYASTIFKSTTLKRLLPQCAYLNAHLKMFFLSSITRDCKISKHFAAFSNISANSIRRTSSGKNVLKAAATGWDMTLVIILTSIRSEPLTSRCHCSNLQNNIKCCFLIYPRVYDSITSRAKTKRSHRM